MKKPAIVIEGYLNRIVVKVVRPIHFKTLNQLIAFFGRLRFRFDSYNLVW